MSDEVRIRDEVACSFTTGLKFLSRISNLKKTYSWSSFFEVGQKTEAQKSFLIC